MLSLYFPTGGFPSDIFVDTVDNDFKCGICCKVLNDPEQACSIGHPFCGSCLKDFMSTGQECCPGGADGENCGQLFGRVTKTSRGISRTIENFKLKCSALPTMDGLNEDTCDWIGVLREFPAHSAECKNVMVDCPLFSILRFCTNEKCTGKVIRHLMKTHILDNFPKGGKFADRIVSLCTRGGTTMSEGISSSTTPSSKRAKTQIASCVNASSFSTSSSTVVPSHGADLFERSVGSLELMGESSLCDLPAVSSSVLNHDLLPTPSSHSERNRTSAAHSSSSGSDDVGSISDPRSGTKRSISHLMPLSESNSRSSSCADVSEAAFEKQSSLAMRFDGDRSSFLQKNGVDAMSITTQEEDDSLIQGSQGSLTSVTGMVDALGVEQKKEEHESSRHATTERLRVTRDRVAGSASVVSPRRVAPTLHTSSAVPKHVVTDEEEESEAEQGVYVGERDGNGRRHGQGVMTYTANKKGLSARWDEKHRKGNVYTGQWQHGKRHGQGRMEIHASNAPDKISAKTGRGDLYVGEFQNDLMCGKGRYEFNSGAVYEGGFQSNMSHGDNCILISANGDRYEGGFVNDEKEGHGRMLYANGDTFEGDWKRDKRQGKGVLRAVDGKTICGTFHNGGPVLKKCVITPTIAVANI